MAQADYEGFTELAQNPDAGDEKLPIRFSMEPMLSERKSAEAGRPIFEETEFIRIMVPGDSTNIIFQPVDEVHKRRFARRYAEWKKSGANAELSGTLLSAVTFLTAAQVKELEYFGVRTVEQLADLSDGNAQKFPGIQALKAKAKDFLEASKGTAHLTQMRAELEKRDADIEAMRQEMKALRENAEASSKSKK